MRAAFPSTNRIGMGMGYTSTEAGAVIASIGGAEFLAHPTSTGRINVTTEVELRDGAGKPVPDGEYGEVHVRSPYLMLGYWFLLQLLGGSAAQGEGGVAFWAHVGGFLAGVALIKLFEDRRLVARRDAIRAVEHPHFG